MEKKIRKYQVKLKEITAKEKHQLKNLKRIERKKMMQWQKQCQYFYKII